ncbi:MAG: response regulator transcription factor [Acidimicrobiia bacterium]
MKKHILIVEDEQDIASALAARLINEGYLVSVADNGKDGLDLAINEPYEVAILDIMLPGLDGLSLASKLRANKDTSILILSARDSENDIISGLEIGADDYVTKPFSTRELVARVNALIRRRENINNISTKLNNKVTFGTLTIDPTSHSIFIKDEFIHTTPTEFKLLSTLCSNPGAVYTREELVEMLTIDDSSNENINDVFNHGNLRTVDSHIRSLRKKIGPHFIRTVHAVGYAFEYEENNKKVSA